MKKVTKENKLTMLKNQINNIDVIGRVLTQEGNLIEDFKKKNNIVSNKEWFTQRAKLDKVQESLKEVIDHFEGRAKAIESQLKLLELAINKKENK